MQGEPASCHCGHWALTDALDCTNRRHRMRLVNRQHHTCIMQTLLRGAHRKLVEIHRTAADDDDRAVSPGTHVREERVRHFDHAEKVDLKGSRHALEPWISNIKDTSSQSNDHFSQLPAEKKV